MLVAIEIGGTFTDLVAIDETGQYIELKVSSTPRDPSIGAINALNTLFQEHGIKPSDVEEILHGSTVATNAVIERKGAKVGLLITDGFRDVPFIQRQNRGKELYIWKFPKPEAVVSRKAVAEIKERVTAKGEILEPLDEVQAMKVVSHLLSTNPDINSLAVCFLHSYRNPIHEKRMKDWVKRSYPDLDLCISCEILPQFREYERVSTTLLTAYMKPVVNRYLTGIAKKLSEMNIQGKLYVCRSSGGILPVSAIKQYPAEMLVSGPAAGVTGAIHVGRQHGITNVMTVDMGGTSTDVSLVTSGRPEITTESAIDNLPLGMPMMDIVTIGAGGGSIARIDQGGMMHVGPQSAGAEPGPACYNMGGQEPTITDALLLNGFIRKENVIGGRMELSLEKSRMALKKLARKLGCSENEAADQIIKIAISNIAQAMRIVSIERGYDPRGYILCVYGGAGPLLGAYLMRELRLQKCVIPRSSGIFSAWGLLVSDYKRDYVQSILQKASEVDGRKIVDSYAHLQHRAKIEFQEHSIPTENLNVTFSLDLRYVGQQYELNVPVPMESIKESGIDWIVRSFHDAHRKRYGHYAPDERVEIVNARLAAVSRRKRVFNADNGGSKTSSEQGHEGLGRLFLDTGFIDCAFLRRESLKTGFSHRGPLVIEEKTSTVFVPPGFVVSLGELDNLLIEEAA